MAMLGETVFALGTGLTDAGYDPAVTRIHHPGALVL
jgi:pantoate kinase